MKIIVMIDNNNNIHFKYILERQNHIKIHIYCCQLLHHELRTQFNKYGQKWLTWYNSAYTVSSMLHDIFDYFGKVSPCIT